MKLVDGDGGMLHMSWEGFAEEVVAARGSEELARALRAFEGLPETFFGAGSEGSDAEGEAAVLVARDTRPTGEALLRAAIRGVEATGARAVGRPSTLRTTPQLHWQVYMRNRGEACEESDYFARLRDACSRLLSPHVGLGHDGSVPHLVVDCANGVGALKMPSVLPAVASMGTVVTLKNRGDGGGHGGSAPGSPRSPKPQESPKGFSGSFGGIGILNHGCGADFVQKERALPECFEKIAGDACLCLSLDGDADRVVFFVPPSDRSSPSSLTEAGAVELLDGDKILCLIAAHLKPHLRRVGEALTREPTFGCIQTAYANGSATRYAHSPLSALSLFPPLSLFR